MNKKNDASFLGTVFNLSNTIIGSGTLAIPFAFLHAGWGMGIILLVVACFLSATTMIFLDIAADATGKFTYKEISYAVGGKYLSIVTQLSAFCYTTGTCIGYIIFLGGFIPRLFGDYDDEWYSDRSFTITIISLLILPLTFFKNLSALRFSSFLAILCILYTMFTITIEYFTRYKELKVPAVMFNWSWDLFRGFPIMTVAFCGHYNVLRFYDELQNRSTFKISLVQIISTCLALVVYIFVGTFGYLSRGDALKGNVLVTYPYDDVPILAACASFVLVMAASFPLVHHAERDLLDRLCFGLWKDSDRRRIFETITLVSLIIVVAIAVSQIEVVLVYNGAIFGVLVVYVFPSYFVFKTQKGFLKWFGFSIIIIGVFVCIIGVILTSLNQAGIFK
ncbi:vacuolar amino acid transporter, putative [Entamoeba invadens IP1]|uniref:Vacuolar amino acid transporter, putative n=1 Tax=Entamoeba invadens IP1 TaxID=370355 RepID=A0A0A1U8L7_ENTIV|nr:vacuolar amino acid transporter, putative [Entamoeba invadens IP1]ELP89423.1 vacuolar amino acid transporter, putative [Entamoeba invadens IP1]|eukprot:XP_004256194.1 vacuolar amino acid transporter, putative [Entamoeba invadens IP1]